MARRKVKVEELRTIVKKDENKELTVTHRRMAEILESKLYPQEWNKLTDNLLFCALQAAIEAAPQVDLDDGNQVD